MNISPREVNSDLDGDREKASSQPIPEVSFVVPAYNEERFIQSCLESIRAQRGALYEIIVVDNNCTDGTNRLAAALCDRVVICREQGIGAARNHGASHARGKYLAFVDADAKIRSGWLDSAVKQMKKSPRDSLSGWNFFMEKNPVLFLYFNSYSAVFMMIYMMSALMGVPVVAGNNLLIERAVFLKAGGFPRCVAEDMKLSKVLNKIGATTSLCPGMRIAYSSRRLRHSGFLKTMSLWIRSVFQDIPERDYRIDY
jgi:cellulose synthase/poly-beta-1,6-N-acetylglucosamine synthase-like glycosyltransferase